MTDANGTLGDTPVTNARTDELDRWLTSDEPLLAVASPDGDVARWARATGRFAAVVAVTRREGTALECEALLRLFTQLQRVSSLGNLGPAMMRIGLAQELARGAQERPMLVAIDGVGGRRGLRVDDLIAELGSGVRVVLGVRVERPASSNPEEETLAEAFAPMPPALLSSLSGAWAQDEALVVVDDEALVAWPGRLAAHVVATLDDLSSYVLATAHAHLAEIAAPLSAYRVLTTRAWHEHRQPHGSFRRAWDAFCARKAALAALSSVDPPLEALALAVRAMLLEVSLLEPLRGRGCDLLGAPLDPPTTDEVIDPIGSRDWGEFLARARAPREDTIDPDPRTRVRRALGGAGAPRGFARLVDRVLAGEDAGVIARDAERLGVRGAALLGLVVAAAPAYQGEVARALWPRARPALIVAHSREDVFDLLGFAPHLARTEAILVVTRALEMLANEPCRPDLLSDGFGHDLWHLLPLLTLVGDETTVAHVLDEIEGAGDVGAMMDLAMTTEDPVVVFLAAFASVARPARTQLGVHAREKTLTLATLLGAPINLITLPNDAPVAALGRAAGLAWVAGAAASFLEHGKALYTAAPIVGVELTEVGPPTRRTG